MARNPLSMLNRCRLKIPSSSCPGPTRMFVAVHTLPILPIDYPEMFLNGGGASLLAPGAGAGVAGFLNNNNAGGDNNLGRLPFNTGEFGNNQNENVGMDAGNGGMAALGRPIDASHRRLAAGMNASVGLGGRGQAMGGRDMLGDDDAAAENLLRQRAFGGGGSRSRRDSGQIMNSKLSTVLDRPRIHVPPRNEGTVPLSTDEDENWLSEFLCFVRADLVEVFCATKEDVASRINSKKVVYSQVGIRCRYCASYPHCERASRSSCYPSSICRIYQSLTMMIRDHFSQCSALPTELKKRFFELKGKIAQGATDSKRYWIDSARKIGMVDTDNGIIIDEDVRAQAELSAARSVGTDDEKLALVVEDEDKGHISPFLFTVMSQVRKVKLTESERVGNRKSMELDTPGFCCRYCFVVKRKGLSRCFPARRRALPGKVKDLYDHLSRCRLCPDEVKQRLRKEAAQLSSRSRAQDEREKAFYDRVWARLQATSEQDPPAEPPGVLPDTSDSNKGTRTHV